MVTIHEVARHVGVGVATVSRVLNNTGQVREETRQRVLAAVDELGFRPNRTARGLARRRLATIAALVPFITHPSAVARVQGMVDASRDLGMPVSLFDVELPEHQREHLRALTADLRPEGLVIVSLHLTQEERQWLRAAELRPVLIDVEIEGHSTVVIGDEAGGALAPDTCWSWATGGSGSSETRRMTSSASPPARCATAVTGERSRRPGPRHTQRMSGPGRTAGTRPAGSARLTTVRQPLVESGRRATRVVEAERADQDRPPERVVLDMELVVRDTTGHI